MERYRVFLSSPSDVLTERDRAEAVVKRLNARRIDQPQLELIRWELDYYGAQTDFQSQIPKPSECELVVCIFWKRLGSDLPDEVRADRRHIADRHRIRVRGGAEGGGRAARASCQTCWSTARPPR